MQGLANNGGSPRRPVATEAWLVHGFLPPDPGLLFMIEQTRTCTLPDLYTENGLDAIDWFESVDAGEWIGSMDTTPITVTVFGDEVALML